jgi:fructosamine-3-kinase
MPKELISANSEARIYLLTDSRGERRIVKESDNAFLLRTEARMLEYLAPHIRVPAVLNLEAGSLSMEYIPSGGGCAGGCEAEIADAVAALHACRGDAFGFDYDTTIGPFRQRNRQHARWIDFYREERVLDFAKKAYEERQFGRGLLGRLERFSGDFEHFLREPSRPSLLHGDIWSGNVLTRDNRFAALIDPAIYYGHYEMELAFIGMFHTFGEAFYRRYAEHIPIEEGFFDVRAPIYRLFPYLVHVRAFGSGYLGGLEKIMDTFGY